jgi:nitroreductase
MEISQIIKNRRSVRQFQEKEIEEKILDKLIEALIWAPSAGNLQSRKFYFVFGGETKDRLVKAGMGQNSLSQAPLVVVGCANQKSASKYGERGKNVFSICDVAASIQNMMLQAQAEGLGTCWVGAFDENKVSDILNLASDLRPIVICPVGYPAEEPKAPPRVSKDKAVEFIK